MTEGQKSPNVCDVINGRPLTGNREVNGVDSEEDGFFCVLCHFAIGSQVEKSARRIVAARSDSVATRVILHRVDVGLVSLKILWGRKEVESYDRFNMTD